MISSLRQGPYCKIVTIVSRNELKKRLLMLWFFSRFSTVTYGKFGNSSLQSSI